ncbi:NADH-quinone oxidoreductase subunit C [Fimbriimonas ginsengisoli]|uniref:NADH dehydrogenase subunit C n=1 Tax=Fimbriimonas ginsengisoli Gsoil 348 TaxID=661478 RepID=A0A068NTM5_FIMGI|nr:NADH-quinone oxidoreductase subunit C [Fimbriimonas ginsengisoli]AIE86796.1 NADH dehydrogenase subunit C [Fimbriimonas ginsengisoli Gsoil 348]
MPYPMVGEERLEVVRIREQFGEALLKVKEFRGETYLCVDKARLPEIARFLKEDPELQYEYFVECLGVDYSQWEQERDFSERFEVVYNLMSLKHAARIFLKVGVDDGQTVPSLIELFLGAEYPEREVQDLYGIVFEGNRAHPGERFLLPDDWIGFPLRKEYPLGGEDVLFDRGQRGPAVEDVSMPHAGESFEGKTGSEDVSGR